MAHRADPPHRPDLIDMAMILVFLFGDTVVLMLRLHWPIALGWHLALVGTLWLIGHASRRPMLQIATVLGFAAGPIGAGIAALLAIGLKLSRSDPDRDTAWYRLLSGKDHDTPRRTLAQDLLAQRLGKYTPPPHEDLATILSHGSRGAKQAALRWLAGQDLTQFADEIRLALDNSDNTIRIEAAALMGRIKEAALHDTGVASDKVE